MQILGSICFTFLDQSKPHFFSQKLVDALGGSRFQMKPDRGSTSVVSII